MTITINGTTGIAGVDGSAGTPAVQGADTNTGVFFGTDTVTISTGGTAAVTVDSGQRTKFPTTIGVGNATPSTSGSGISFPATASASSDANTLDDYEEGTFTPNIVYSGTNTPSHAYQLGRYTKIGRIVQIQILFSWNENGSTGNVTASGLPFTSVNSFARGVPSILSIGLTGLPTNISVTGRVNDNATTISFYLNDNAGTALSATYTDNDQDLYFNCTYEAA